MALVSAEAAAEAARFGRAFEAQQLNLRQAHPRTAAAVDTDRFLGELAAGGIVPSSAQGDGIAASASASGRSTSDVGKRSRAAACRRHVVRMCELTGQLRTTAASGQLTHALVCWRCHGFTRTLPPQDTAPPYAYQWRQLFRHSGRFHPKMKPKLGVWYATQYTA